MNEREVKTRQTMEQASEALRAIAKMGRLSIGGEERYNALHCFDLADKLDAALASVILPEVRFDIPDWPTDARALLWQWQYHSGVGPLNIVNRPLPKTVELTTEEKLNAVFAAQVQRMPESIPKTWAKIANDLANGKTLDQLCQEYGVETVRRVE